MYAYIYIYTSPCPDDFSMRSMVGPCRFQQKKTDAQHVRTPAIWKIPN